MVTGDRPPVAFPAGRLPLLDLVLVVALAVALPLATLLPLRAARRAAEGAGDTWTGLFPSRDHVQYAALAAEARARPTLLLANPYDDRGTPPTMLALALTATGVLAGATGRSIPQVLTGLGAAAVALLVLLAWRLAAGLFPDPWRRRTGLLLVLLSGGLAFFAARAAAVLPSALAWRTDLDFSVGWSVLGAIHNPLWAIGLLASLALLAAVVAADRSPTAGRLLLLALLAAIAEPTHPYLGAGSLAIGVLFAATGRARLRLLLALAPGLVVAALHAALVLSGGADAPGRIALHRLTPSVRTLLGGYGLLLPLAAIGALALLRRPGPARRLLLAWAAVGLALVLQPFVVGVKFLLLLQPALALLAAEGLAALLAARTRLPRLAPAAVVLAALVLATSAPQVLRVEIDYAAKHPECRFAPGELEACAALRAAPPGLVLSAPDVGTRLPWLADRTPFLGHWFLTPRYRHRLAETRTAFAAEAAPADRIDLLDRAGIVAVLVRARDRDLLAADPPAPFFRAFEAGECVLFLRGAR